eukprot:NODE_26729_length_540_cov_1.527845.p4 GENE.NODE_26729_length_540_cov_1.527845~~NODE_26729_length_540_cov_1.527845.p4  ORF type:complete len:52 (+),score=0.62 NODE_26729_length_540_cov_1.527845:234-389(+)
MERGIWTLPGSRLREHGMNADQAGKTAARRNISAPRGQQPVPTWDSTAGLA